MRNSPPKKGNTQGRRNSNSRNFDPDLRLKKELRKDMLEFLGSGEERSDLPPMNSYQRRIAHNIAKEFELESFSEGEGEDRHNVIKKTENSYKPTEKEIANLSNFDFGDEELFTVTDPEGIEIFLYEDGFFGLRQEGKSDEIIDRKRIFSGSFKIKNRRIIDFNDVEW